MAMRAAKNAAMRELAEKIYGADVWASTSVVRGGVYSDTNRNSVEGLVRGARVVIEIERLISSSDSNKQREMVVLPAPEGEERTIMSPRLLRSPKT